MSTKTTIKRIALVAVSALGLGMVSTVSAHAADTTSFSVVNSSITVVGASSPAATFKIQLDNADGTGDQGLASGETLTATVVGVPTGVTAKTVADNAADLAFAEVDNSGTNDAAGSATDGVYTSSSTEYSDGASTARTRQYNLKVSIAAGKTVLDQGTYTIRLRLVKNSILIQDSTIKVTFVTSAVDSGAVLTLSTKGAFYNSVAMGATYSSSNYIKATIADANGGKVVNADGSAPSLTGDVVDSTGAVVSGGTFTLADDGGTSDYGYSSSAVLLANNGVYGGTWTPALTSTTNALRVRFGAASAKATVVVYAAQTGSASNSTAVFAGTGLVKVDASNYTAPLTTKTTTLTVTVKDSSSVVLQDVPVQFVTTWTGVAAGDQTPLSGTTGLSVVKTNSSGQATLTVTNSYPVDGNSASVQVKNGSTTLATVAVTWAKSKSATATTSTSPNANFTAALKSTNTVTWTFVDAFGAPVVGETINLSLSGANNAAGTLTIPSAVTDAKGQVSYTWTDAAAVSGDTDVVTATSATTSATLARTVTYKTAVPVIASLAGKFNRTYASSQTYPDVVPSTTIYSTAAGTDGNLINSNLNPAAGGIAADDSSAIHFQYTATDSAGAAVTGVPVTVSISDGGWIRNSAGTPVTSRIIYPAAGGLVSFDVVATTTGTKTITVTAGTVSKTATVSFDNAATDARVLSAVSNGGSVVATVKDAFGNTVAGVDVKATASAGALLANGANSGTYTTASDGTAVFSVSGSGTVTLTISTSTYAKSTYLAGYADAIGSVVQTGAPAGVAKVTLDVTGTSATDSVDAANEATDAANAATDAANAAAEAADAATAAAQDAQAAVAALATQVASLIAGIKAQITTLTNLVIKIQKKVRA